MGTIVLQFCSATSLGSRVIEWYDHGRFSHVDSVLPDGNLLGSRDDVTGGKPAGVQIRPADYLSVTDNTFRISLQTSDQIQKDYYEFITNQIGKEYDEEGIMGFVAGRNWRKPDTWFCSELVAAGLEAAGFLLPLVAPANKIAPDDLLLVLSDVVIVILPPIQ